MVEVAVYEPGGEYYGLGSGFFIDDEGTFVTNYHVIDGTVSGEITLEDGSVHDITGVKAYDETLDLAIVQADVTGNDFLTISEQPVRTGETVYAIGSSEGLTGTFSDGIVSTASRDLEGVKCIQITAPISHGNSGGPLVNVYGQVVGINSMSLVEGQNLNFAIDVVELEQLNETDLITLSDLYDIKHPEPEASVSEDEGFYADADGAGTQRQFPAGRRYGKRRLDRRRGRRCRRYGLVLLHRRCTLRRQLRGGAVLQIRSGIYALRHSGTHRQRD